MKDSAAHAQLAQSAGYDVLVAGGAAGPTGAVDDSSPDPSYRPPASREPGRRTLLMQALVDTFSQTGARVGAVWIAIVVFLAVFAPFLASSFPFAMQMRDGRWQFPLFSHLSVTDVVLVVLAFAALLLAVWRPLGLAAATLVLVSIGVVATILCAWLLNPPKNIIYEEYRQAQAAGDIVRAYRTIVPYSANDRMNDRPDERLQSPSQVHWLGTTIFGEDMLSRMVHACRVALTIGLIATGIAAVIGIAVGGVMGYFVGLTDLIGMRLVEIIQSIPRLILLLIVTASFGRSIYLMMVVIGLVSWTGNARFIRAEFLKLRKQDFVQAGIAAGLPLRSILFRHMLPNGIAPVLVESSFGIAGAILLESTLSFLGLGLAPEDSSWGQLLNQARSGGTGFNWWIATFPGLAIFLTVFAYILIGEAMRDALDPQLRKRD
jgi:peptide/nickel transport system permease protein